MRYAIVNIKDTEKLGIKKEYHILNNKKDMMIVNENELAALNEKGADHQAERLGVNLITRKELQTLLNKDKSWMK